MSDFERGGVAQNKTGGVVGRHKTPLSRISSNGGDIGGRESPCSKRNVVPLSWTWLVGCGCIVNVVGAAAAIFVVVMDNGWMAAAAVVAWLLLLQPPLSSLWKWLLLSRRRCRHGRLVCWCCCCRYRWWT